MRTVRVYLNADDSIEVKNVTNANLGEVLLVLRGEYGVIAEFATASICGYRWVGEKKKGNREHDNSEITA